MTPTLQLIAPRIEAQIAELERRIASWSGPKNTLDYACTKLDLQTARELYEEAKRG